MKLITALQLTGSERLLEEDLLAQIGEDDGDVCVGGAQGGDEVAVDAGEGEEGDGEGDEGDGVAGYDEALGYHGRGSISKI